MFHDHFAATLAAAGSVYTQAEAAGAATLSQALTTLSSPIRALLGGTAASTSGAMAAAAPMAAAGTRSTPWSSRQRKPDPVARLHQQCCFQIRRAVFSGRPGLGSGAVHTRPVLHRYRYQDLAPQRVGPPGRSHPHQHPGRHESALPRAAHQRKHRKRHGRLAEGHDRFAGDASTQSHQFRGRGGRGQPIFRRSDLLIVRQPNEPQRRAVCPLPRPQPAKYGSRLLRLNARQFVSHQRFHTRIRWRRGLPSIPHQFPGGPQCLPGDPVLARPVPESYPEQLDTAIPLTNTVGPTSTNYYMIPSPHLPLLDPVRAIPVIGTPIADLIEPDLRYLVNWGYGDPAYGWSTSPPNVPAPFGVLPPLQATTSLPGYLAIGTQQGVNAFVSDINAEISAYSNLPSTLLSAPLGASGAGARYWPGCRQRRSPPMTLSTSYSRQTPPSSTTFRTPPPTPTRSCFPPLTSPMRSSPLSRPTTSTCS
ncbi:PE-PPE domain protein [Mycobacterium ulcerans str. Harvey]|uniref:PE-PPE domain protein n=1 Tax=Mycobacterium ulcerans str. Harvey TaxID=1299332 RepID=A0ABN0QRG5_MYCUL|nr:PE-PPE domain protein [Mycobacterium ulcerans str. Harvey]